VERAAPPLKVLAGVACAVKNVAKRMVPVSS
jgi:hypothetical protein